MVVKITAKVVLFGFAVAVFDIVVDISDAVFVAIALNLQLVRVVLPLDQIMNQ